MARDLEEGRRLTVDALSGAVVRRGTKHGIPTPVHSGDRGVPVGALAIRIDDSRNPGALSDSSLSEEAVMRLTDKVAIVTGAGSGIGAAIARTFAPERAKVPVPPRSACKLRIGICRC
jgi:hypothetical protein